MFGYFSKYFWICSILFLVNQVVEGAGVIIPYVHAYLDDLLCPGIVMGIALFVQQQLSFRNLLYTFSYKHLIFFVLWYSLLFEVVFPAFDTRHFADLVDVVAYTAGSFGFYRWGNNPAFRFIYLKRSLKF